MVSSKKITCGTWSSLFSLPVKELEFNQIGSTSREIGEVCKSGSAGIEYNKCETALVTCGDAVVMIVGQTPTAMTHKPTARPGETPS